MEKDVAVTGEDVYEIKHAANSAETVTSSATEEDLDVIPKYLALDDKARREVQEVQNYNGHH